MKIRFTCVENKPGYNLWILARELLHAKRNLRTSFKGSDYPDIESLKEKEREVSEKFYNAKEIILKKK